MDFTDGAIGKNLCFSPRNLQAMGNVGLGFGFGQRLEVVADGDSFPNGPVFRFIKQLIEHNLPHQDDVQQPGAPAFHVGQQPNLFYDLRAHDLSFIDNEQGLLPPFAGAFQEVVECFREGFFVLHPVVNAEALGHQEKEIVADQAGVGQLGDHEVVVDEPVGKCADERGFTGSDIAGQQQQPLVLLDSVTAASPAPPDAAGRATKSGDRC